MTRHPILGIAVPELGWVPSPTYLLRRQCVLGLIEALPRGRLLEIGCGAGAILDDFAKLGYRCDATETSEAAHKIAAQLHAGNPAVAIHRDTQPDWPSTFDLVVACEVLEHIDDDGAALSQWRQWLKPGGRILISVPAHRRRWNASDEWAGHFRRYEKSDLLGLLGRGGFEIERILTYGFPIANLIEPVRAAVHRRSMQRKGSAVEGGDLRSRNTSRSGIERGVESKLYGLQSSMFGVALMRIGFAMQSLFSGTDLGPGYIVLGRTR